MIGRFHHHQPHKQSLSSQSFLLLCSFSHSVYYYMLIICFLPIFYEKIQSMPCPTKWSKQMKFFIRFSFQSVIWLWPSASRWSSFRCLFGPWLQPIVIVTGRSGFSTRGPLCPNEIAIWMSMLQLYKLITICNFFGFKSHGETHKNNATEQSFYQMFFCPRFRNNLAINFPKENSTIIFDNWSQHLYYIPMSCDLLAKKCFSHCLTLFYFLILRFD